MSFQKTCKHCGSVFAAKSKAARYCSEECQIEVITQPRVCQACGESYRPKVYRNNARRLHTKKSEYCSLTCAGAAKRARRIQRTCATCGTDFEVRPSDLQTGSGEYCSRECCDVGRTVLHPKPCARCGTEFKPRKADHEFCSRECAHDRTDDHGNVLCAGCNRYLDPSAFHQDSRTILGLRSRCKTCTANEAHARRALIKAGEDVDSEQLDLLRYVLQDDRCTYCGDDLGDDAQLDHIRPLTRDGTHVFENLQYLCAWCNRSKQDKTHDEYVAYLMNKGRTPYRETRLHPDPYAGAPMEVIRPEVLVDVQIDVA